MKCVSVVVVVVRRWLLTFYLHSTSLCSEKHYFFKSTVFVLVLLDVLFIDLQMIFSICLTLGTGTVWELDWELQTHLRNISRENVTLGSVQEDEDLAVEQNK